jgi:DNA invertase Pin-like site-specific DNA recombinase
LRQSKSTLRIRRVIAGYVRVSSGIPDSAQQQAALRAAGCTSIYVDDSQGRDFPARAKALKRLRASDVIVVQRLDRLGASFGDVIRVVQQIEARGAHLRSLLDLIDTTKRGGADVFRALTALAVVARSERVERARHGMQAAKQRGQAVGRPRKLSVEQVQAAGVRFLAGEEIVDIAASLGVSALTIRRALKAHALLEALPMRQSA